MKIVKKKSPDGLLRVGGLAKAVGKTVRAMHLYEELGLLQPAMRTDGGFRLYDEDAVHRINWIIKLQAIGFTLAEIQGFAREFETAASGREATTKARDVFSAKLEAVRQQITQLRVIENDIEEALQYLDACGACSPELTPVECHDCDQQGHVGADAPPLFAGLAETCADSQLVQLHVAPAEGD